MSGWPRSWLFAPADDERKLASALRSSAEAVIADLEDAVAPDRKAAARAAAVRLLAEDGGGDGPWRVVRVNDPRGPLGRADLDALAGSAAAALMVPKATPESVALALEVVPRVVALVESAAGVLAVERIAVTEGVIAVAFGSVDLAAELSLQDLPDDQELLYARSRVVLACAAAGVPAIDGVHVDLADAAGLEAQARRGRALGFAGKLCIHPRQLDAVGAAFAPSAAERERAERMVAAYERAQAAGSGAILLDGEMVDVATVRRARRLLGQDQPTAPRNGG